MTDVHNPATPAGPGATPTQQPNGQGQPPAAGNPPQNGGGLPSWYAANGDAGAQQQDVGDDPGADGDGESGVPAEYVIADDVAKLEIAVEGGGVVRVDPSDARLPEVKAIAKELSLS